MGNKREYPSVQVRAKLVNVWLENLFKTNSEYQPSIYSSIATVALIIAHTYNIGIPE